MKLPARNLLGLVSIVLALVVTVVALAASADEHAYVGSQQCRKCHIKEYRSWQETTMAKAFEGLKPGEQADAKKKAGLDPNKDYTKDPSCLKCHVTGYGKAGGFTSIEDTPDLAGVGCEMCHGPGGTYLQDGYMTLRNKEYKLAELEAVGLIAVPTAATCAVCHNEESPFVGEGYVFNFEERKAEGIHERFPLKYEH